MTEKKSPNDKIEVCAIETGYTETFTRRAFVKKFGKYEANAILKGHRPHIVAVEV